MRACVLSVCVSVKPGVSHAWWDMKEQGILCRKGLLAHSHTCLHSPLSPYISFHSLSLTSCSLSLSLSLFMAFFGVKCKSTYCQRKNIREQLMTKSTEQRPHSDSNRCTWVNNLKSQTITETISVKLHTLSARIVSHIENYYYLFWHGCFTVSL